MKRTVERLLQSHALLAILAGMYPMVFVFSKNNIHFSSQEIASVTLFSAGLSLIASYILWMVLWTTLKISFSTERFLELRSPAKNVLFAIAAGAVLLVLLRYPIVTAIHNCTLVGRSWQYIFLLAFVCIAALIVLPHVRQNGVIKANVILSILLALSFGTWETTSSNVSNQKIKTVGKQYAQYSQVRLRQRPNVYIVLLESYTGNYVLKNTYNFDNSDFENKLASLDFQIAPDVYSNYSSTKPTVFSLLLMDHLFDDQGQWQFSYKKSNQFIGGQFYNPTLAIFKDNGYKTQYIHPCTYCYNKGRLLDVAIPCNGQESTFDRFIDAIGFLGIRNQTPIIGNFFDAPDNHPLEVMENWLSKGLDRIEVAANSPTPWFTFIKTIGPGHAPNDTYYARPADRNKLEQFRKNYPKRVEKTNAQVLQIVQRISQNDPDAIVVLFGDHGALFYKKYWIEKPASQSLQEAADEINVSVEDLAASSSSIFFAVRCPKQYACDFEGVTNVNIMRRIFRGLATDESKHLLGEDVANSSYIQHRDASGKYIAKEFVRNSVVLPDSPRAGTKSEYVAQADKEKKNR